MSAKIAFFLFFSFWVSSCWAGARFFPDRNKETLNDFDWATELFMHNFEPQGPNRLMSATTQMFNPVSIKLRGDTDLGYYYITLFFGSPGQRQSLIVDTGSSITTFPCDDCVDSCGTHHFNQKFNRKESDSFSEFTCREQFGDWACNDCTSQCYFNIGYAEGSSYYGHFKKDIVTYGNEAEEYYELSKKYKKKLDQEVLVRQQELEEVLNKRKMVMPFGCANKETKLFKEQAADGILGLGISTNSRSYPPNLFDVYEMNYKNSTRAFSICYAQSNGYITIGGYNTEHHYPQHQIQFVPYHDEYNQFRVVINRIEVNGKALEITVKDLNKGHGAFFDSGTTYTHVPSKTHTVLVESLRRHCESGTDKCGGTGKFSEKLCWIYDERLYSSVSEFYDTFPTFDWYFGEEGQGKYEWKPEDYLYTHGSSTRHCMGLARYESETILGGTFMKNHDVLFDKNNKQLSFVRSNCQALFVTPKPVEEKGKDTPPPQTPPEEKEKTETPVPETPTEEKKKDDIPTPPEEKEKTDTPVPDIPIEEKGKNNPPTPQTPPEEKSKDDIPVPETPTEEKGKDDKPVPEIPTEEKGKDGPTPQTPPEEKEKPDTPVPEPPTEEKKKDDIPVPETPTEEKGKEETPPTIEQNGKDGLPTAIDQKPKGKVTGNTELLIKIGIVVLIGVVLSGLFYVYILMRKKAKYSQMESDEVQAKQLGEDSFDAEYFDNSGQSPEVVEEKNDYPEYEV